LILQIYFITFMEVLLFFVTFIAGFLVLLILTGLLISIYWKWFIIPIFNVKPINIPQALGLSLFVSFLTSSDSSITSSTDKTIFETIAKLVFYYLFYYVVGYILHFFVKTNTINKKLPEMGE
jgi:hypothetical protein